MVRQSSLRFESAQENAFIPKSGTAVRTAAMQFGLLPAGRGYRSKELPQNNSNRTAGIILRQFLRRKGEQQPAEDISPVLPGPEVSRQMLSLVPGKLYTEVKVGEGETGLVYYDNVLQKPLSRGIYRFWNYKHSISYKVLDMKQRELDIVGQEILTKDKIGIRMNVSCIYKIRDAVEFAAAISDLKGQLYSAVQLAIREIVGNYKLDEILEAKERISAEIYEALKDREGMFCVHFLTAGIKDIILPGEIRAIMNSVLVAEKTAQANVISRREEVASTRSLLNTAKLMEENQTLYKLKELEYLERICGKVGEISVNGNAGIVEQLGRLMGAERAV